MEKEKRLYLYIIILSIFVSSIFYVNLNKHVPQSNVKAQNGIIDFENANIETENLLLDGTWSFYWNEIIKFGEFDKYLNKRRVVHVPKSWENYKNEGLSELGYATYRLKMISLPKNRMLAVRIIDQTTAYKLYINGKLVAGNGEVGRGIRESIPEWKSVIGYFETDELGEAELVIHISNFHYYRGGLWNSIEIGTPSNIYDEKEKKLFIEIVLFSTIIIVSIIFLGIYFLNPADRVSLYFSIFCFCISGRVLLMGERMVTRLFPQSNWFILVVLEYVLGYSLLPLLGLVINSLYQKEKIKITDKFFKIFLVLVLMGGLFLPIKLYASFLSFYKSLSLMSIFYFAFIISKAINNKNSTAYLTLLGYLAIFLSGVKDVFIKGHFSFIPVGTLFFIVVMSIVVIQNFTNLIIYNEKLEKDAKTDSLTGLIRRDYFINHVRNIIEFTDEGRVFYIAFIDLDKFKAVNDNFGHDIGDAVLRKVSEKLKNSFRNSDLICRYGGDEFLIYISEIEEKTLLNKLNMINKDLLEPFQIDGNKIEVGMSIGLCEYPRDGKTVEELIKNSDSLMYSAKQSGGNKVDRIKGKEKFSLNKA